MAVYTGVAICDKCRRLSGWVVGWQRSHRRRMLLTMETGAGVGVEAFLRGRRRRRRIWILRMRVISGRN